MRILINKFISVNVLSFNYLSIGLIMEVNSLKQITSISELKIDGLKKQYIQRVIHLISKHFSNSVIRLGVFGSVARGTADEFSDVDLIIVYKDNITKIDHKNMVIKFLSLERQFSYQLGNKSFDNSFLRSILHITGMFRSIFLVSETNWKNEKFKEIFNLGPFINIIAPKRLVFSSVILDLKWIQINEKSFLETRLFKNYSLKKLNKLTNPKIFWIEWIRSYITAQLLSLGAFFITPFFEESTKFSIEAVKWSLNSFILLYKIKTLSVKDYSFLKINNDYLFKILEEKLNLQEFSGLRSNYYRNPKLNFLAMGKILKVFSSFNNLTKNLQHII
ncbi:MAG: hypothetical protein HeimC3_47340 [Candidatus Heimdallarchaeota archaeon LC_3]|nr:MAG: hypothetical protein HeimC3_47340 [Candidatus Heimdallarchaeota archaeon LC_3]